MASVESTRRDSEIKFSFRTVRNCSGHQVQMIALRGSLQGICTIAAIGETTAGRIPRVFDVTIDDLGKRQFYERRIAAGAPPARAARRIPTGDAVLRFGWTAGSAAS